MSKERIGIGVIGLGHWGPNHLRIFNTIESAHVVIGSDLSVERRAAMQKLYPAVIFSQEAHDVISHPQVQAVVIATPVAFHYPLAKAAMEAGKHVLLEKPMCLNLEEARDLLKIRQATNKVLMHGHIFLHNPGIRYLKDSVSHGDFGNIQYLDATRTNLGPIRKDVNVVSDLAAHEFSIFDTIFGKMPRWISAVGSRILQTSREDVAFISMEYPGGALAHVHVSWLHPQKIRHLTVVGDKKMVVWDDLNSTEPVRVYDKGLAEEPYYNSFGEFKTVLRDQDVLIPKINAAEPLKIQNENFLKKIISGDTSVGDAESGLRVMQCLIAANQSLAQEGKRIYL